MPGKAKNRMNTFKKLLAEFIGTFVFLTAITGSAASGNTLKQIALALTLGLMILTLGGVSGGHFNPAVSLFFFAKKSINFGTLFGYIVAQLLGALAGTATGFALWQRDLVPPTGTNDVTAPLFFGEVLATAGLVFIIATLVKNKQANLIWAAVAAWIFAAGTFTYTGAMANPAVTFGLLFAGFGGGSVASLIVAQLLGLVVTILLLMILDAKGSAKKKPAEKVLVSAAPAAKKTVAKKPAAKKTAVKKPAAKKPAAKKPAAKK